jgi:ZIP family zinc transporter
MTALGAATVFLSKTIDRKVLVEVIAGIIGAATVLISSAVLPYALSFAAGAMIFVVVEDIIPESQSGMHTDFATMGAMIGLAVMMVLDVAFS